MNTDFNIGDRVSLINQELQGTVKDKTIGMFMVELDNGDINAYYTKELKYAM